MQHPRLRKPQQLPRWFLFLLSFLPILSILDLYDIRKKCTQWVDAIRCKRPVVGQPQGSAPTSSRSHNGRISYYPCRTHAVGLFLWGFTPRPTRDCRPLTPNWRSDPRFFKPTTAPLETARTRGFLSIRRGYRSGRVVDQRPFFNSSASVPKPRLS